MTLKGAIERICDTVNMLDREVGKSNLYIALQMAIKALEKQIPQKIDNKDADDLVNGCHCCGEINALWKPNGNRNNYCGNCGQAIDWSDTEC